MSPSLNIVVLGHTIASPDNQIRWRRLAELYPDSRVTLFVPKQFTTYGGQGKRTVFVGKSFAEGNYRQERVSYWQRIDHMPLYWGLKNRLRTLQPDVIYAIAEVHNPVLWQTLWYRQRVCPQAKVLFHSNQNLDYTLHRWRHRAAENYVFRQADALVAENATVRTILARHGFTKPCLVQAAPGANERSFQPGDKIAAKTSLGLAPDSFVVGFVGGLRPDKGPLDLARAFVSLGGKSTLLMVGDGPLRSETEKVLEDVTPDQTARLVGFVPRSETVRYYQAMDALVLPSITSPTWAEQFGNVLAEAMLCRTAVVGSTCGAIPEVIGEAGLVFPEGDVDTLAKSLRKLRDEPVFRQSLAERGLRWALEEYSASALSRRFHDFCTSLL
jgi:glycosyltransferase involved in cell wall biosynthesis